MKNVFDIIVYGDHEVIVGKPKDESAFRYVVEKSGIPAENHVYIGDREKADILPPKSIGMKTIAVGKEILSADASVPFVYDIKSLIIYGILGIVFFMSGIGLVKTTKDES